MAIKKVVYFETTNGLTFDNESDAIEAENKYQIRQSLFNLFDANDFSEKDCSNISTFIVDNKERILEILTTK